MQLAAVDQARVDARFDGEVEVRILEHDRRIRTAKLEDRLLQDGARLRGDSFPRRRAARQRHSADQGILNHGLHLFVADEKRSEHAPRESGLRKDFFNGERAARHVRGVLQHAHVAGHQRGRGKPVDLPERKVPRHDGEDDAERLECDV